MDSPKMIPVEPIESGTERPSSTYNAAGMSQIWNRLVMLFSAIGIFIAGVLSYSEAAQKEVPCGIGSSCTQVTTSPWSHFGDIPVAYLGLATYALIFIIALLRSSAKGRNWNMLTLAGLAISGFGFGFSVYLQIISIKEIGEVCKWCFGSAVTMFFTFLWHGFVYNAGEPKEDAPAPKLDFAVAGALAVLAIGGIGGMTVAMQQERAAAVDLDFSTVTGEQILPIPAKIKGSESAQVTIVEFADMNCPSCRATFPKVEALYNEYQGKLRLAFRHLPLFQLPGHETSPQLAIVSEMAAEKGKFWEYMDKVMDPGNTERIKGDAGIIEIGSEVGLDPAAIRKAIGDPDSVYLDRVTDDMSIAQAGLKITSTPTFVVLAKGHPPKAVLGNSLADLLKNPTYAPLLK